MSKSLRLKSFQPEEEYVYLTYSLKNNKKEESKILLESYKILLHKALDWLWDRTRIERKLRRVRKHLRRSKSSYLRKRKCTRS